MNASYPRKSGTARGWTLWIWEDGLQFVREKTGFYAYVAYHRPVLTLFSPQRYTKRVNRR